MNDAAERALALREELQQRIAAVPGIAGVALADSSPFSGGFWNEYVFVEGVPEKSVANFTTVSGNYFQTLGIPVLKGRTFGRSDVFNSPPVAVVNEAFVRKLFPDTDPLGRVLWVETGPGHPTKKIEIVGVARDTKYYDIKDDFEPMVHLSVTQSDRLRDSARLLVKPRGSIDGLMPAITRSIGEIDPAISVEIGALRQTVSNGLVRERLMASLAGAFGALAGLLAAVGLYGVMSYTVARRSNEMGIRLALGARRSLVLGMVLREAAILIGAGLAIGLVLGLGASTLARNLLFGLQPWDPPTVAAALAMLAIVGIGSSYLPARRASLLDPVRVLRDD